MKHNISAFARVPIYLAMILVNSMRPVNRRAMLLGFVGLILVGLIWVCLTANGVSHKDLSSPSPAPSSCTSSANRCPGTGKIKPLKTL